MRSSIALIVVACLGLASVASADQRPPPSPSAIEAGEASEASAPMVTERYGWQLVVGEFAGVTVTAIGGVIGGGTGAAVGAGVWVLGIPAIHVAHGNPGSAVASLGIRQIALWGGFLAGLEVGCAHVGEHSHCKEEHALTGAAIGYAVGAVIDVVFLAKQTRAAPRSWQPSVAASDDGFRVGVGGTF